MGIPVDQASPIAQPMRPLLADSDGGAVRVGKPTRSFALSIRSVARA